MEIRTFTSFWKLERKVYSIQDVALPVPISLTVIGIFALVAIPWFILCYLIQIPFAPPIGYLVWLAPPIAIAYFGSRPIFEGKTLAQFAKSQFTFLLQNRAYKVGLQPDLTKYDEEIILSAHALTRIPKSLPFMEGETHSSMSSSKTKKTSSKTTKTRSKKK